MLTLPTTLIVNYYESPTIDLTSTISQRRFLANNGLESQPFNIYIQVTQLVRHGHVTWVMILSYYSVGYEIFNFNFSLHKE